MKRPIKHSVMNEITTDAMMIVLVSSVVVTSQRDCISTADMNEPCKGRVLDPLALLTGADAVVVAIVVVARQTLTDIFEIQLLASERKRLGTQSGCYWKLQLL